MFQGQDKLNLDAKARFVMPVRHRGELQQSISSGLTLTKSEDGCLMLFPAESWQKFRQKVVELPLSARWWKRIYLSNAIEVEMDKTGRVLIAPVLREHAKLQKEILLLGMGGYFEVWDAALYNAAEVEVMQQPKPEALQDFTF